MAKKKWISLPFARKHSHFTLMFEKQILKQCKNGTISGAATILREHDTRIWRVLLYYVNECRKQASYENVSNIGIDETSKKGHNYLTTFVNLDTRRVMYVADGKDNKTVIEFLEDFKRHKGIPQNIKNVTSDMSLAFEKGIKGNMLNAKIIIDKFHVIKYFNEALNKTLRDDIKAGHDLKKTKYIWMKNKGNLTEKQLKKFDSISNKNTKTARAYQMKLVMQEIYRLQDKERARKEFKKIDKMVKIIKK